MTLHVPFDNSYGRLPARFYTRLAPTPVAEPGLVAINEPLARDLGIDPNALKTPTGLAALAGNAVPTGADPLAQVYAGHQFGGFVHGALGRLVAPAHRAEVIPAENDVFRRITHVGRDIFYEDSEIRRLHARVAAILIHLAGGGFYQYRRPVPRSLQQGGFQH